VLDGLDTSASPRLQGARRDARRLPVGAEALAICEPIYEEHAGWKESTVGIKSFDKLPPPRRSTSAAWKPSSRRPWRSFQPAPIGKRRS
jgi:adenylosuccinate synthase